MILACWGVRFCAGQKTLSHDILVGALWLHLFMQRIVCPVQPNKKLAQIVGFLAGHYKVYNDFLPLLFSFHMGILTSWLVSG